VRSLLKFFLLTYLLSWTCWIAAAKISAGDHSSLSAAANFSYPIFLLGVFAPSLVALGLTAQAEGRAGLKALLQGIGNAPAGLHWYVFAAGYMLAVKLTVALLYRITIGSWPPFGPEALYIMLIATVFSTPVQAGEEIGWRAFALPRLAESIGLGWGSIVLGVIWACWHLPLFFLPGLDTTGQSFPVYLLQVTAISVIMAWLYWRTNGSLLLTMLLHAAINNTKDIVPSAVSGATNPLALSTSLVAWFTLLLLWICAIYFLFQIRGGNSFTAETLSTHYKPK